MPESNLLGPRQAGFVIAQDRLGPGRIHHCMRAIGSCERAIEMMCARANSREAFGSKLAEKQFVQDFIAKSRIETDQARLLTLNAAWRMDTYGKKEARREISMIKVVAANVVMDVLDRAIQVHGSLGMSDDTPLAGMWRFSRMLKVADGPDEVHKMVIARRELNRAAKAAEAAAAPQPFRNRPVAAQPGGRPQATSGFVAPSATRHGAAAGSGGIARSAERPSSGGIGAVGWSAKRPRLSADVREVAMDPQAAPGEGQRGESRHRHGFIGGSPRHDALDHLRLAHSAAQLDRHGRRRLSIRERSRRELDAGPLSGRLFGETDVDDRSGAGARPRPRGSPQVDGQRAYECAVRGRALGR